MFKLAWRNLARQKARTGMAMTAVALAVAALILSGGFVEDIFVKLGEAIIHSQTGHLQIARQGYFQGGMRRPTDFLLEDLSGVRAEALRHPDVEDAMGRLYVSALLGNGARDLPVLLEGIEPDREARLGTFLQMQAGRRLAGKDTHGAMVGAGVANALRLKPGDAVTLLATTAEGALNTAEVVVIGVFQSFSKDYDGRAVKVPLEVAQQLLETRGANVLVVSLKETSHTDRVAASLLEGKDGRGLEARRWSELNDFYQKTLDLYARQFGVLRIITLVLAALAVAGSINMSVMERIGEFGTMQALGNRSGFVRRLILVESAFLGVLGAALGTCLGTVVALTVSSIGIPMPPPPNSDLAYVAQIRVLPNVVASAFAIGILASVLSAVLPALRVGRLSVVDALRQNA